MNILIVGSGAREHAIAKALQRSPKKPHIFCFGTSSHPYLRRVSRSYQIGNICDVESVISFAQQCNITIAIIGPEAPLAFGIADHLWKINIPTIGPKKSLAQIETSKSFARNLMKKYGIKGLPRYQHFTDLVNTYDFLQLLGEGNYVVKADGLMSGKGVKVAGDHLHSIDEAYAFCESLYAAQHEFVIEEKCIGQEFSLLSFCDGNNVIPMPLVQDHKRAFVQDKGPNTGGMGSYSDTDHSLPFLTAKNVADAMQINEAVLDALQQDCNEKYKGFLYGSFIVTASEIKVIEFNARLGDPEALNVLALLETDFVEICKSIITGNLSKKDIHFSLLATVCKYTVPVGYPEKPIKNDTIDLSACNEDELYLAGVDERDGKFYLTGSRAVAVVGTGKTIAAAERIAENAIQKISGPVFHREDIGTEILIQKRIRDMQNLRSIACD